ncbi:MAG: hypothetical protein [Wendovervirus sonii]|uniref:Uncharacterized protein n=1 Tax=phage Lak_Megaphage_Sonny TaxID=3109229 RepID=A0ABZ0Z5B0_9CAUD|nr:MAG: hypothetical protein [phage Lak_Megaphage_Sonny]
MTILNIIFKDKTHYIPPFMINYTNAENELLNELIYKWDKNWYIVDPVSHDQAMVIMYKSLPSRYKKKFTVNEIDIPPENYENGGWKYLCMDGLYPKKRYDNLNHPFYDQNIFNWISCDDKMPEQVLNHISSIYTPNLIDKNKDFSKIEENTENSCIQARTILKTPKILVKFANNDDYAVDRRILMPEGWQWEIYNQEEISEWTEIRRNFRMD